MISYARSAGRAVFALVLASIVVPPGPVRALQPPSPREVSTFAAVPFTVGEELVYRATFAGVRAGQARMRVDGIDTVRGRAAYHMIFTIDGGIPGFRVHDRYESWVDVETLASLRHVQQVSQGRYRRNTVFEIWPERLEYQKNAEPVLPSVANPLDEGSFLYAVRGDSLKVGETRADNRYFRPDRNPVVIATVAIDTVKVGAGTFVTTVVRPSLKSGGLFGEDSDARIWFSADSSRLPVQVKMRLARFPVTLSLDSVARGKRAESESK